MQQHIKDDARKAHMRASSIAALEFGSSTVEPEHLLLSLLESPDVQRLLNAFSKTPEDVKLLLENKRTSPYSEEPCLADTTDACIRSARRITEEKGEHYVGSCHFLLGILHSDTGKANHVLTTLGITLEGVEAIVFQAAAV